MKSPHNECLDLIASDVYGGTTHCLVCRETFRFVRDRTRDFPEHWHLHVVHDHDQDPPQWTVALFHRPPRGRFPPEAKEIAKKQKDMKAMAKEIARLYKVRGIGESTDSPSPNRFRESRGV